MNHERCGHTATLLPSGKVLAAGGQDRNGPTASAETYDPATDLWSPAGEMHCARSFHTATLLTSGKVLVAGGAADGVASSVELYDPATNSWVSGPSMHSSRSHHTATLLPAGNVLVVGGVGAAEADSVEIYDPTQNDWRSVAPILPLRSDHTATLLPSGKVIVAGGTDGLTRLWTAMAYDSAADTWSSAGSMGTGRSGHTATLLTSGKILVAGGVGDLPILYGEVYDPATGSWSPTVPMRANRTGHTATLLASGNVLVVGGASSPGPLSSAELYEPEGNRWSNAADSLTALSDHTATLLPSGAVLVAGGNDQMAPANGAELFEETDIDAAHRPAVSTACLSEPPSHQLLLTGGNFAGGASGPACPQVQLRNLDNGVMQFLSVDPTIGWSDRSIASAGIETFPLGYAMVTVYAEGVPSEGFILRFTGTYTTVEATPLQGGGVNAYLLACKVVPVDATGTVNFFDGDTRIGAAVVYGGYASLMTTTPDVGPHSIVGVYGGDAQHAASTSPACGLVFGEGEGTYGSIVFDSPYYLGVEGSDAVLTVVRASSDGTVESITWTARSNTAVALGDFGAPTTGTLLFTPTDTKLEIHIPLLADPTDEGVESFVVSLSSDTPGLLGAQSTAVVLIQDVQTPIGWRYEDGVGCASGPARVVQFNAPVYCVGETSGSVAVTATRPSASSFESMQLATNDGSAVTPNENTHTSVTLHFSYGVTSKTATIPVAKDAFHDVGNEFFNLTLTEPSNGMTRYGVVVITGDDTDSAMGALHFTAGQTTRTLM